MSEELDRRALAGLLGIGLAHDLRNLLSVAETSAFLAAKALDGERDKAARHLDRIGAVVREAQSLLTATLAMSRGEGVATEALDVAELVASATRFVRGEKPVDVVPLDGPLTARASRPLATAAIVNLLKNASDAATTRVTVRARREGDRAILEIEDDGPGFPEGFEITAGRTTKSFGHGLGLATARAAIEAMGGALRIDAGRPGGRVSIALPRS